MNWNSEVTELTDINFPEFSGIRILMMPFKIEDQRGTLPNFLDEWRRVISKMTLHLPQKGTAYVTIDEREVDSGLHHRRPGLHVDGWADESDDGIWGAGGWGISGLIMAASHVGSAAYRQRFNGEPKVYGDCEHLRGQCKLESKIILKPNRIYSLGGLTVHETLPAPKSERRQFIRISAPSNAGWPMSCTANPLGIQPSGRLMSSRPHKFTNYEPRGNRYA